MSISTRYKNNPNVARKDTSSVIQYERETDEDRRTLQQLEINTRRVDVISRELEGIDSERYYSFQQTIRELEAKEDS